MAITDLKLKDSDITAKGVVAAPTVLAGTPEENKKIFDRLIREVFQGDFNGLIDALTASTGAGEIGASVDGLTGGTVQALLTALKAYVDDWESETITSTVDAAQAAADSAAAAAAAAESISQHPPRVSSSNTWEIWDEDSGAYVDSGKPTKGDNGVSPKITSIEKVQSTTGGGYTKINFTDADGAHSITINDGEKGEKGAGGTHGDSVTVTATAADATDEHPNGGTELTFTTTQYHASGAPPTVTKSTVIVWNGNDGGTGDGAVSSVNGETGDVKTSFVVNATATFDNGEYANSGAGEVTVDKTPSEIYAAYQAGKQVYCRITHGSTYGETICTLEAATKNLVQFSGTYEVSKRIVLWSWLYMTVPGQPLETRWTCWRGAIAKDPDNTLGITGASVGQIPKITAADADGKPTAWEAVDMPSGGTTETEVQVTASVSKEMPLTIDSRAAEQVVNLAWNVPGAKTIPAFTNYYVVKSNITYPRAFDTSGYTQTWGNVNYHGNSDAYVSGHLYFCAMEYEMDGDSTARLLSWGNTTITPSGTATISGSGWVYGVGSPTNAGATSFGLSKSESGTGTIKHLYCIDVTALLDAGTISSVAINDLVALFGGLDLIPGQDFAGETTSGTATLTIKRGDVQQSVDSPASTATIEGGDVLSVSAGTVSFVYVTTKVTGVTTAEKPWADKKWCAFGDSLTDPTINATKKYHAIIAEKTGISVTVLGKGGTGYYKTKDDGTAYYQRMANCPADADVVTIFGSVNDWNAIKNGGLTIGNASDAMSAGTYSGYVNECIDVAISKAPYAQIALITPMDYHGLPDETLESIANALLAVAKYRKVKCLDLYHTSGFRVDDATYAQAYTTDYSATADTYGHPSNVAHERLIAPVFLELLKGLMLYV